jgi:hypothetical protein
MEFKHPILVKNMNDIRYILDLIEKQYNNIKDLKYYTNELITWLPINIKEHDDYKDLVEKIGDILDYLEE